MLDVKTPKTECKGFHCTGKMAIKKPCRENGNFVKMSKTQGTVILVWAKMTHGLSGVY